ncbi:glycine--tRNA ligase subunit beta [Litchfieldia salsa]|uniref:Glycine--tRNA ligase beta subunit n=1 Tax=Litchfieldia salsa TaxID=930152 RepID=A0A1H0VA61_9BACI|nr:glycine--tRNA ligase subunit beta [Litchfieldia salsa]SDP75307.1 glycyl-tRNA synthetase beta chain [Litchfieldia salsa]
MNKRDLLIEIGLEEMPARFITDASNQLTDKVTNWLLEKNISYETIQGFSSPRRLAVLVTAVSEKQEDVELEAKGPAKKIALDQEGNWTKAAIGFTKGQTANVEDIYFKEINGIEYVHVTKFIKGQETKDTLFELEQIITNLSFPKNMRWGNEDLRFVRPIKWLLAIFGEEIIPISITGVASSNTTLGHRFLGAKVTINRPSSYETELLSQYVIANALERKEAIQSQIKSLADEHNWVVPIDEDLLEEVTNLVEYPTALYGKYEEEFLDLPEEVLITSMKEHQRYFPVKSKEGQLLPYFITIRNGDHKHIDNVAKGNEKVLRARLSDADFFYKEDQKKQISDLVNKLDAIVYHEEIGTLGEKVRRIQKISIELAKLLGVDDSVLQQVNRTAEICKFDLVTHMVYEFPELQGLMGEKYALINGEDEAVAKAINEHYMPRHAEDDVPASIVGAIVSIADKLDTIISCFSIGIIPTGSQDPYALRRQSAGIVQILLEKEWDFALEDLLSIAINNSRVENNKEQASSNLLDELINFFKLRIKNELSNRKIRYDITEAVLGSKIDRIGTLIKKAVILDQHKEDREFKDIIEALSRILNIAKKGEDKEINPSLFQSQEEKNLYTAYSSLSKNIELSLANGDVEEAYNLLADMKEVINQYFDHTMVMAEDENIRVNRLAQMVQLSAVISHFANVNSIVVK